MKNKISVSGLAMTGMLMLASAVPALAIVTPALMLSDGTNIITIDGNGAVTTSGACSLVTCITTSSSGSSVAAGTVSWSGTIGNFTVAVGTPILGQSKPALVSPAMDVGIPNVISILGGKLTVQFTDTGFNGISPTSITPTPSFPIGSGSVNYTLYVDNTNAWFGMGTTSATITGDTGGSSTASGAGITANPFSMTEQEVITLNPTTEFVDDFSANATAGNAVAPPSPMISLTKTASATTVSPYQKVTYTYVVTNSGTVPLTNVVITDDNATPTYTKDDVTVCTIASLAPTASTTCIAVLYPPVTQGANDSGNSGYGGSGYGNYGSGSSFNYNNYHPGGQIICKSLPNGDVQFTYLEDEETADNTYGNGSSGDWGSSGGYGYGYGSYGNPLSSLLNGKNAQFQVFDAKGNKCLDFNADYLAYSSSTISGYGVGSISINSGNGQNVYNYHSSICDNLNQSKAFARNCFNNSPSGNVNWEHKCAYTVTIKAGCWGSNGFGSVQCVNSNNNNSKGYGHNQHQCQPVNSTVTNTAVATATYGTGTTAMTVISNKPSVTVTIVANPPTTSKCVPLPTTCNVYGQAPSQCKPQNGGHDGDGYSYCDALLSNQLTCKDGTPFQLGSAYGPSATCGGSIPLPTGKYSHLRFLGAGVNGNQTNQCFTIHYTDGSSTNVYQNLSDWCYPSGFSNESVAVNMPYRIAPDGSSQYISNNLYEYNLPCDNTKTVKSVTLPNNRNCVVHAITMVP